MQVGPHISKSYNCLKIIRQMHQVMSTHYPRNKDKTSQLILGHCESKVMRDWFTLFLLDSWTFVVIQTKWPARQVKQGLPSQRSFSIHCSLRC